METKKIGKPRKGLEVRKVVSIRLEPKIKEKIKNKFKSVQKFVDLCIKDNL